MAIFNEYNTPAFRLITKRLPLMKKILTFLSLLLVLSQSAQTQATKTTTSNLIQVSGVVLDQDSLTAIPFVSVLVKGSKRATVSDVYGFFTLVVNPGEELQFTSLTHKTRSYRLSDTTKLKYQYIIQVLTRDTLDLPIVDVYPWPSKEDFKRAFLNLDLNETDAQRADRNLEREDMTYMERTQPASAAENYRYVMNTYYTKVYTAGQSPQNNLLNPLKWAEFVSAWRQGKFSSKKKSK